MKRVLLLISLFWVASLCTAAQPQIVYPSIQLARLDVVKTSEKSGDELYFSVTVYPNKGRPSHYEVPRHPLHWPSKHLDKLKQAEMWKGTLHNGESASIILSLIERDAPPWNTDDLIGSIRVDVKNSKGHLEATWGMPNRAESAIIVNTPKGPVRRFELTGQHSQYFVYLGMKDIGK